MGDKVPLECTFKKDARNLEGVETSLVEVDQIALLHSSFAEGEEWFTFCEEGSLIKAGLIYDKEFDLQFRAPGLLLIGVLTSLLVFLFFFPILLSTYFWFSFQSGNYGSSGWRWDPSKIDFNTMVKTRKPMLTRIHVISKRPSAPLFVIHSPTSASTLPLPPSIQEVMKRKVAPSLTKKLSPKKPKVSFVDKHHVPLMEVLVPEEVPSVSSSSESPTIIIIDSPPHVEDDFLVNTDHGNEVASPPPSLEKRSESVFELALVPHTIEAISQGSAPSRRTLGMRRRPLVNGSPNMKIFKPNVTNFLGERMQASSEGSVTRGIQAFIDGPDFANRIGKDVVACLITEFF
ncbi:hypothetical protein LIER_27990 [Lithospermum erythrorhizon]|uniref:Uncharacterized protein n=1 Tax=Lithospermum erythrorhizon TaxID=34254 RepID=A0AAV3RE30_LITER